VATPHDDLDAELALGGVFGRVIAPLTFGLARGLITAAGLQYLMAALALLPYIVGWTELEGANRAGLTALFVIALITGASFFATRRVSVQMLERLLPVIAVGGFTTAIVALSVATVMVGPTFGAVAVFFVETPLLAFVAMRFVWGAVTTGLCMAGFAIALVVLDNPPAPAQQFLCVMAAAVTTGVVMGGITNSLERSRREERRAKAELASLNRHLEERVSQQVNELERAGRLRRFLSPQIAEVVTSEGAEEMLAPHRRDIAAFFVDLRGFTAFTNAVTAERVMRVLDEYYDAVGSVLDRHGATIGGFDGDGVFAYLGDPVPHEDAAGAAVRMAQEVASCLDRLTPTWASGDELGYGVGLAYGEATLGLVGFANRADYTPVGGVVNMAARLCADARHSEIVIDDAMRKAAELDERSVARRDDVDLKGFGETATYAVAH
jgi:class 3 adenylate cyclase